MEIRSVMQIREEFPSVPGHKVAVIVISGDISNNPLDKIRQIVGRRIAFGCRMFALDICGVNPIVTKTIGTLLPTVTDIKKAEGRYWFISNSRSFDEVLQRTKLTEQFPHSSNREEAIKNLTSTAQ